MDKAPLTPLERKKLLNLYARKIFNKRQIKNIWGWTVEELRDIPTVSERHFLVRCPNCKSHNTAMRRNYGSIGIVSVNALCRECHTYSVGKDYDDAKKLWNNGIVHLSH